MVPSASPIIIGGGGWGGAVVEVGGNAHQMSVQWVQPEIVTSYSWNGTSSWLWGANFSAEAVRPLMAKTPWVPSGPELTRMTQVRCFTTDRQGSSPGLIGQEERDVRRSGARI